MTNLYLQTDRQPTIDWDMYQEEFMPFKGAFLTPYNGDFQNIEIQINEIFDPGDIAYLVYVTFAVQNEYGWQIEYQYCDAFATEEKAQDFGIELNNYKRGASSSLMFEFNGNFYVREWMYYFSAHKQIHIQRIEIKE